MCHPACGRPPARPTKPAMFISSAVSLLLLLGRVEGAITRGSKERPVMKVVRLLEDMGAELQKGLDDEQEGA